MRWAGHPLHRESRERPIICGQRNVADGTGENKTKELMDCDNSQMTAGRVTNMKSMTFIIGWRRIASATTKGPFKCYVTQMGVGGCLIFWKKALRRCNVQCY